MAAEAKYHPPLCTGVFQCRAVNTVGKPADAATEHAFSELCNFLDETDECQYSLSELLEHMETFLHGEDGYSIQYLEKKLKEHYGNDIIITSIYGKYSIVSFCDTAHRILHEKWMAGWMTDKVCQNDRIIHMAASIIRDEI